MIQCILVDFDETLTKVDTTRILVISLLFDRPWLIFIVLYGLLRLRLSNELEQIQEWKNWLIGWLLRGRDAKGLQTVLARYSQRVKAVIRNDVLAVLKERKASGLQIIVVTSSFEDAVDRVVSSWGFQTIGTRFSKVRGAYNGRLADVACFGQNKVGRVNECVEQFKDEYVFLEAWSDSLSDAPLMSLAESKIWVCPASEQQKLLKLFPDSKFWTINQSNCSEKPRQQWIP